MINAGDELPGAAVQSDHLDQPSTATKSLLPRKYSSATVSSDATATCPLATRKVRPPSGRINTREV
ncbi:hypothetical protein D3C71_1969700 [compost metagenome]